MIFPSGELYRDQGRPGDKPRGVSGGELLKTHIKKIMSPPLIEASAAFCKSLLQTNKSFAASWTFKIGSRPLNRLGPCTRTDNSGTDISVKGNGMTVL